MINKYPRVPYGLSVHGSKEIKAVTDVLKNSTQMGINVINFEKKLQNFLTKNMD